MHSHVPLLRPWYRSLTFWTSLLGAVAILWAWIDSRYHRTEISSGGLTGIWTLNNRSAVAIGFWTGRATSGPPEFRVNERDPENFVWTRFLEVGHSDYNPGVGYTLYLPHYMLITTWIVITVTLLAIRGLRKRRVLRQAGDAPNQLVEAADISRQIESESCESPPHL